MPNFPIVAPYIAIKTEPTGLSLTEVFSKAKSVIVSGIFDTYPSFKSPVFNHGIFPPKYSSCVLDGVAPEVQEPTSPSLTHSQLSGMSKGFSSSGIGGNGRLDDLAIFDFAGNGDVAPPSAGNGDVAPPLVAKIFSSNSAAVPSSGRCSTSLPWMASRKMLFFSSCGVMAHPPPSFAVISARTRSISALREERSSW